MPSSPAASISVLAMQDAATAAKPAIAATKAAIVDALPPDPIAAGLEELCRQQMKLRKERKDLARQVKNAKKKVQRMKVRARALTDDDLVAVLMMRKAAASAKSRARRRRCDGVLLELCVILQCRQHGARRESPE